jgi:hypothetical protein
MKSRTLFVIVACLLCLPAAAVYAWCSEGHQAITEGAVSHLPQPLQSYFLLHLQEIKTSAGTEPPGTHYIDIDWYPEFPDDFPRDINVLIARYGASTVESNGTAPWTVRTYTGQLSVQMITATTAGDWQNLLQTAGALAHYVEDLHNPLHLTVNYNGQNTGNTGIHSRYECEMVSRKMSLLTIEPTPSHCVYLVSPLDTIFDGIINDHYWYVDDILATDTTCRGTPPRYNTAYYNCMWTQTGAFTDSLFQEASETVASAWYTAWVNAGRPQPMCSPGNGDFDGGGAGLSDVPFFVNALLNPSISLQSKADLSGDCVIDGQDISLFVAAIIE